MSSEATFALSMRLPHPWPPVNPYLLSSGQGEGILYKLWVQGDGTLHLETNNPAMDFVSQPIAISENVPCSTWMIVTLTPNGSNIRIAGKDTLKNEPGVPALTLTSAEGLVKQEFSVNDPNKYAICHQWIQNRKAKFQGPPSARPGRRLKTIDEQAHDLWLSSTRLRLFQQLTLQGSKYLLGTLAGEIRATIYWPKGRDSVPDTNWNPLLLRMASLADLPLPVYSLPLRPEPDIVGQAVRWYHAGRSPRVERIHKSDELCDLQEAVQKPLLRIGVAPGRVASTLEVVKELAHTMGASHYDIDASEFVDLLGSMQTGDLDHITIFICQTAETLAALSDWVLLELKNRNLIQ